MELKRVYDIGTVSIVLFLFLFLVLPHCVHTGGEPLHSCPLPPLPSHPNLSPPTHFSLTLLYPPPTSGLSFPSAFVHHRVLLPFLPHTPSFSSQTLLFCGFFDAVLFSCVLSTPTRLQRHFEVRLTQTSRHKCLPLHHYCHSPLNPSPLLFASYQPPTA